MFDDDPFSPPAKKSVPLALQIENASIEDLESRIAQLKEQIVLCEQAIAAKRAQRAAADAVFSGRSS